MLMKVLNAPLKIVLFCVSVSLMNGCAGLFRSTKPDLSRMTVEELRDRIERNHLAFRTLVGRGKISAQMPGAVQEASVDLKIIMPDSLYLKVEAIFGIDVGTFVANKTKFALHSPMQKVLYTGNLSSLDLSRFFQVDISYQELFEAAIGTPKLEIGKAAPLKIQDNQYVLNIVNHTGLHRYRVHPVDFVITRYQYYDSLGTLQIVKEFSKFEKYGNVRLPKVILIQKIAQKQVFALFYSSRKLNTPIDPKTFKIRVPPKSTRHIRL